MISFSCFNFIKFQAIPNDQLFLVGTKIDGKEKKPRKGTTLDGPGSIYIVGSETINKLINRNIRQSARYVHAHTCLLKEMANNMPASCSNQICHQYHQFL